MKTEENIEKNRIMTEELKALATPLVKFLRDTYVNCVAGVPNISYGEFYDNESFNIAMQSCFNNTTDK